MSATPVLLGALALYPPNNGTVAGLIFQIEGNNFRVFNQTAPEVDLTAWLARQSNGNLVEPWIDFVIGERKYRYAIDSLTADLSEGGQPKLTYLYGTLFASSPTPTP